MGYYVGSGEVYEAVIEVGITGLVGTIALRVEDNQGNIVTASSTANIIESGATGIYQATRTAPVALGQYSLVWSDDGSYSANHSEVDDLTVQAAGSGAFPPMPVPVDGGAAPGPCTIWTLEEDVAACCSDAGIGSDFTVLTESTEAASQLLYELSGRKYAGLCSKTVRPACDPCYCGYQVLSRGHIVGPPPWGWYDFYCDTCLLACEPSVVKLSGYPVREITDVKINGASMAASEYSLYRERYALRLNSTRWPLVQNLTLPDTEEDTWSITYTYGANPPIMGQLAARQLACELYKNCVGEECALPSGVTRTTRQGITIEKGAFAAWGYQKVTRGQRASGWGTGLSFVDAFLNAYNPEAMRRRPSIWSPGRQYARPAGT